MSPTMTQPQRSNATAPGSSVGDDTVDIATLGAVLRRQWPTVLLVTALFLGAALA